MSFEKVEEIENLNIWALNTPLIFCIVRQRQTSKTQRNKQYTGLLLKNFGVTSNCQVSLLNPSDRTVYLV